MKEEQRFREFMERREELKKERIKALFDAERSKNDLREAFMQMNVWNAWNTTMVDRMLYNAMREEDPHHAGKSIGELVRADASKQHSKHRRTTGASGKEEKKERAEERMAKGEN